MKNTTSHLFFILLTALFAVACAPNLISMYNVHGQSIPDGLTLDQVGRKIKSAAGIAGWSADEVSPGLIVATNHIRAHTVTVNIRYTEDTYNIDHEMSYYMKISCTAKDKTEAGSIAVSSGPNTCPGNAKPAYIHENYKGWIDELNTAIQAAFKD